MPKTIKFFLLIVSIFAVKGVIFGQNVAEPSIEQLLEKASEQGMLYTDIFKNLTAEETKNIELYDKQENVEKKQKIISTFIIYETVNNEIPTAEFRNVLWVDGKPIKNNEKRAQKFFEKIVKAESSEKELRKLADESLRYDLSKYYGFTLYKGIILAKNLMPYFDFEIAGKDDFAGNDVYVVKYRQTKESPDLKIDSGKNDIELNARLNGLLWIDANTFQIWREERERTVQPEIFKKPVVTTQETYEYQKSEFGILTPKKITLTSYAVKILSKTSVKNASVTLEYGKFSQPETEVKSAEIK